MDQRNVKNVNTAFYSLNTNAKVYINLLYNTKMLKPTKEIVSS